MSRTAVDRGAESALMISQACRYADSPAPPDLAALAIKGPAGTGEDGGVSGVHGVAPGSRNGQGDDAPERNAHTQQAGRAIHCGCQPLATAKTADHGKPLSAEAAPADLGKHRRTLPQGL